MLHGFNLRIDELDLRRYEFDVPDIALGYELETGNLRRSLSDIVEDDGIINGDKMGSEWFPKIEKYHVFISHSHKDIEIAKRLKAWLKYRFEIEAFVDSMVWGHADDLLKIVDDMYCLSAGGATYEYSKRNISTSNIYLSLAKALDAVIDHCECLIFINTDNSTENKSIAAEIRSGESTYSPWIMSELRTSSIIRSNPMFVRTERIIANESFLDSVVNKSAVPKVSYSAPTEHLHRLDYIKMMEWQRHHFIHGSRHPYQALTMLYNLAANRAYDEDA